jgi:hypothetical protein
MVNLMDGLLQELNRNRELLKMYQEIPTGAFGAMMIKRDIDAGESAIKNGDTVEMLRAYQALQDNE